MGKDGFFVKRHPGQVELLLSVCGLLGALVAPAYALQMAQPQDPETVVYRTIGEGFAEKGLQANGSWKDPELKKCLNRIRDVTRGIKSMDECIARFDRLYAETIANEKLHCLADDVLFQKGKIIKSTKRGLDPKRVLMAWRTFEQVIREYPDAEYDRYRGVSYCAPSTFTGRREAFALASYYCRMHPNMTADMARLGMAKCYILLGQYEDAATFLRRLVPKEGSRTPSEDPLARKYESAAYLAFLHDNRFGRLVSSRVDKKAMLLLARCKVAAGKLGEARRAYEEMIETFPCSAGIALLELRFLAKGRADEIVKRLGLIGYNDVHLSRIPTKKILELIGLTTKAERIKAARAYLIKEYVDVMEARPTDTSRKSTVSPPNPSALESIPVKLPSPLDVATGRESVADQAVAILGQRPRGHLGFAFLAGVSVSALVAWLVRRRKSTCAPVGKKS